MKGPHALFLHFFEKPGVGGNYRGAEKGEFDAMGIDLRVRWGLEIMTTLTITAV
jgi:hypothetical protein